MRIIVVNDEQTTLPEYHCEINTCTECPRFRKNQPGKKMCARTFGRFDLFVNGNLVKFKCSKAKELLALCIDHRGGEVSMYEAIDKLWEDKAYDKNAKQSYRFAIMQLRKTLMANEIIELFDTRRGKCFIDASLIDCDYYDLLDAKEDALLKFDYTYMTEYSWAEDTLGSLCEYVNRLENR